MWYTFLCFPSPKKTDKIIPFHFITKSVKSTLHLQRNGIKFLLGLVAAGLRKVQSRWMIQRLCV
jgi:hypothetical protein